MNISDWWEALTIAQKVYWCIAVPFSLIFVLQTIMTFFGGDVHDLDASGDSDLSVDHDAGIDFQFITLKNLIAFFTIFGWTGVAALRTGYSMPTTLMISFISGLIMMLVMAAIVYFMSKLSDDGTLNLKNAIGKTGTVYITIPANRGGTGQIQIKVQGLQTLDAMTDNDVDIKTGAIVEVRDVIRGDILLVK